MSRLQWRLWFVCLRLDQTNAFFFSLSSSVLYNRWVPTPIRTWIFRKTLPKREKIISKWHQEWLLNQSKIIRENLMAIVLNCMHLSIGPHRSWSVLVIIAVISSLIAKRKLCRHIKASATILPLFSIYWALLRVCFLTALCRILDFACHVTQATAWPLTPQYFSVAFFHSICSFRSLWRCVLLK